MGSILVNDIHSELNETKVQNILHPTSIAEVVEVIRDVSRTGGALSVVGGRHSMGGQQFLTDGVLLDMSRMDTVQKFDLEHGLLTVEAGITWPKLIDAYLHKQTGHSKQWSIAQKQTGADQFSIGGTVSANSHGRGLAMRPFVENIESLDVIDHNGELVSCSRTKNKDLFKLVVGGYGLFGVIVSTTIRLVPRQKLRRVVEVVDIEKLSTLFQQRIESNCTYGDFQFAIDPAHEDFLCKGVFSTYEPVGEENPVSGDSSDLKEENWNQLALLAHTEKTKAFELYSKHYLATSGQVYWSDLHQLSTYINKYHAFVDEQTSNLNKGTEIITEMYVPRDSLVLFMDDVRSYFREYEVNIIYGTIRLIEKDDETFLAWARESWACIVFNLHTEHTPTGVERSTQTFKHLVDLAVRHGGSFALTYSNFADKAQMMKCHPQFEHFLHHKKQYDPNELFQSNWYRHYKKLFSD